MSQGFNKISAERNQRTLLELAAQPGNDVCADCKNRNPRWASYNLGIFICVHCASIHRKMGTHISKVKSLTMDSWTKDQVEVMKSNGNLKSNALYNPDETRNPPPTNMIDSERDSELEKYIRYKYEYKKFVTRSSQAAALLGPSRSASTRLSSTAPTRSATMPLSNSPSTPSSSQLSATPSLPTTASSSTPSTSDSLRTQSQIRAASQPAAPLVQPSSSSSLAPPLVQQRPASQPPQQQPSNPLWNDLAQLQAPAANSSLPLQYASPASQPMSISGLPSTGLTAPHHFSGLSVSPNNPFPSQLAQQQQTGMFSGTAPRSMSLNTGFQNMGMGGLVPGMAGAGMGGGSPSPSMFQPQPTMGGLPTAPSPYLAQPQHTTPSPNPYGQQSLAPTGLGVQQPFAPASFSQQMLPGQPQGSPMLQPQGSPMMSFQQLQGSPMFQPQPQPQMQMQMGNPGMFMQSQSQPQPQMAPFGSSQPPFAGMGTPSPAPYAQQPQMFAQQSAFGGMGWQQQQPGFPGQQQQWGGM